MFSRRFLVLTALMMGTAVLACNAPGSTAGTELPTVQIEQTVTTIAPTASAPQPTTDAGGSGCPAPGGDSLAYANQNDGYCLVYPLAYTIGTSSLYTSTTTSFSGKPLDPSSIEPVNVGISVAINGPADGLTSLQYAQKSQSFNGGDAPYETTLAGLPAAVIPNVPGMLSQQVAYVVANGHRYTITLFPAPGQITELDAEATNTWNTITGSIRFFPPAQARTAIRAEDVCPEQVIATHLNIDLAFGVCNLYPDTFEREDPFSSGFIGGPVTGQWSNMDFRTDLVIGLGGPANGKTPRQFIEERMNPTVSIVEIQDVMIGGWPAVTFVVEEPVRSRQALIVANDRLYTIVNQPYQDLDFADNQANVELVWQVVTESIAFFDPWQ